MKVSEQVLQLVGTALGQRITLTEGFTGEAKVTVGPEAVLFQTEAQRTSTV